MLTDAALKHLKPKGKIYKVTDRDGMYVLVKPSGTLTFRLDYRMNGRRETVTPASTARPGCRSLVRESCASTPSARSAREDRPRLKSSGRSAGSSRRRALANSARNG
jgi:Arm DNA-binding domain